MSGSHGGGPGDLFRAAGERSGEQRALIALGVGGLALALVLAAFFVGRGFAESSQQEGAPSTPPDGADADTLAEAAVGGERRTGDPTSPKPSEPSPATQAAATAPDGRLVGERFAGAVRPVAVRGVRASCRSEPSIDAGGNPVRYPAGNVLDGNASTAWRCQGTGRGQTLTLTLRHPQRVAEVGLVPGYAKTDPYNGADRYAENRRLARVRWSFDGGRWVEQTFNPGRNQRGLQTTRIPPVRTKQVTVTIKNSVRAERNTVAVSTLHLARPRG